VHISRLLSSSLGLVLPRGYASRKICLKRTRKKRRLGYARVSTYGQTLDPQLAQLRKGGCAKIYREKATDARADRRELLKFLKALAPGDVVTVTRIDRLARSTFDLFAIVKGSWTARRNFAHWRSRGPTPVPARAADDCRSRRPGGRGARPYPHPHGGRPQPGQGAHGPGDDFEAEVKNRHKSKDAPDGGYTARAA
jgi:Resolvase, N terminal domain